MADTDMLSNGDSAPTVSDEYARCRVCGTQWQVRGASDKKGCSFCDADYSAITIHYEGD